MNAFLLMIQKLSLKEKTWKRITDMDFSFSEKLQWLGFFENKPFASYGWIPGSIATSHLRKRIGISPGG